MPSGVPYWLKHNGDDAVSSKDDSRFARAFDRIERAVPAPLSRMIGFLRRPWAMLIRIPLGVLLVLGGIFSILPVLGIWMLPLGLLLLAVDVPALRGPIATLILRVRRWRQTRRNRNRRAP